MINSCQLIVLILYLVKYAFKIQNKHIAPTNMVKHPFVCHLQTSVLPFCKAMMFGGLKKGHMHCILVT